MCAWLRPVQKQSMHYDWSTGYLERGMRVAQFVRTHPDEIEAQWKNSPKQYRPLPPT
jgi:hypothetical protein